MFEGLADLIKVFFELNRKQWLNLIFGIVILLFIGIIAEANWPVLSTIRYRTDTAILKELLELEKEGILDSPALSDSYRRLVADYTDRSRLRDPAIISVTSLSMTQQERLWTLAVSMIVPFILLMVSLILSHRNRKFAISIGFLITIFVSSIIGFISLLIFPIIIFYISLVLDAGLSQTAIYISIPIIHISLILIVSSLWKARKERASVGKNTIKNAL